MIRLEIFQFVRAWKHMDNGGHHLPRPRKQIITPQVALRGRSTSLFRLCIIYSIRKNYNYNTHQICTHNLLNISPGRRPIPFKEALHCILILILTCIFFHIFCCFSIFGCWNFHIYGRPNWCVLSNVLVCPSTYVNTITAVFHYFIISLWACALDGAST